MTGRGFYTRNERLRRHETANAASSDGISGSRPLPVKS
ncbi:hypothetical protein HMPREF9413_3429 [Paenibacillus sp. HGF7]|nr:hypothetical protein HMPREF9413_3429 [Paenibacillus sp. HGF7]